MIINRRDIARKLEAEFGIVFTVEVNGYGYTADNDWQETAIQKRIRELEEEREQTLQELEEVFLDSEDDPEERSNLLLPSLEERIERDLETIVWLKDSYPVWNESVKNRIRHNLRALAEDVKQMVKQRGDWK